MKGICLDTLNWLTTVPAGDVNFRGALNRANAATLRIALESVPKTHKTKTRLLQSRLARLEQENTMAREKKEPRAHDAEAETATQIYQVAKAEAETQLAAMRDEMDAVRVESQAAGALQAIETTIAFQEFLKAITLNRIKQSKEYKKGGMTWLEFCDSLGMVSRTVDMMLADMRPVVDRFSENISGFCGMPFSKIRLLGRQLSENISEIKNNCLVYGDESIPLTPEHRDDIQALIDRISEETREKIDDAQAQLSAKDKVLKSKQELLNKQERELRKFEKQAQARNLAPEEAAILGKIDELGISLNGYCLGVENVFVALNENPFPSAVASFVTLLDNIKARVSAMRESAVTGLAPAGMFPDEEWTPSVPVAPVTTKPKTPELCALCHQESGCEQCCVECASPCSNQMYCRQNA